MFCKPPHPVYIVLFRGDDTDFVGNQEIVVKITTERDISGCKAYFKYMGNIQTFDVIPEDKELRLVFSREQTKEMPLGTWDAELYLIDESGKRMTVNNRIHMLVTNSVREAYFPDNPQAVSVVISANKYIEDAEVSADGKTLTLTKKDGTEVSFSGGGGGGTNDYNDLENKPSINGKTLTGNINLATPEQLSLKADKTNVYTKEDVDSRYSTLSSQIGDISNRTNILSTTIDQHISDTNNPHKVTAAQVGALSLTGGMLTGDLSVGEGAAAARELYVASGGGSEGITLQGGASGAGSSVTVGGSYNRGGEIRIKGGMGTGGRLYVDGLGASYGAIEVAGPGASIKKDGKEVATEASLAPEYSPSSAYSVGAFVYHDGNIYQCTTAIPEGGEAWNAEHWELRKLDDFFTNSNSLLTGTIDEEVIEKGTAPDAHLEAPTDERLKLILADNSVAYDSAKALPYKLTSVIGDRVIATMTLTAASTDITLPAIAANDTTVKDFILDVTNAYAIEGVATDAGINIPRTDFKLVTRDGESLTAVTTVKAGKSAFICFTQKSPVVVDGTTYPCWCVIQLPFGDPS